MNIDIYLNNRKKLIQLYKVIQFTGFDLIVAKQFRMTIEELEGREHISFNGSVPDTGLYNRAVLTNLTIPMMVDIIPNLPTPGHMGYRNPARDSIIIYESIQEYLNIWCNVIRDCAEFAHPTIQELYELELVAQWAYNAYQEYYYQKAIKENKDFLSLNHPEPIHGILRLLLQHGTTEKPKEELSFVSKVDQLLEDKPNLKVNYDNWVVASIHR